MQSDVLYEILWYIKEYSLYNYKKINHALVNGVTNSQTPKNCCGPGQKFTLSSNPLKHKLTVCSCSVWENILCDLEDEEHEKTNLDGNFKCVVINKSVYIELVKAVKRRCVIGFIWDRLIVNREEVCCSENPVERDDFELWLF